VRFHHDFGAHSPEWPNTMDPRGKTPTSSNEPVPDDRRLGAIDRMRSAIAAAANGTGASDAFQAAARELVAEWRRARLPPEQILLRIKEILAEAGLRPTYASPAAPRAPVGAQSEVYRDVIAWTIRHYYEGEAPA
jgi:hypothetical protein